jgi:hypothetical protein
VNVASATSYKIYRSLSSGTAGGVTSGSYTLYDTITESASSSAYTSYASSATTNSFPYSHQCNRLYNDTAATHCVGWPKGTPNATNVGEYFNGLGASGYSPIGYTYKVSAVVAGVESALSADSIIVYFAGGDRIGCSNVFNGAISFSDVTCPGGPSPLGFTTHALWNASSGNSFINPFSGMGMNDQNINLKGMTTMVLSFYTTHAGITATIGPELAGDEQLLTSDTSMSPYVPGGGALPINQWVTVSIPLSAFLIDQLDGTFPSARQWSFYKVTIDMHGTANPAWLEWSFKR